MRQLPGRFLVFAAVSGALLAGCAPQAAAQNEDEPDNDDCDPDSAALAGAFSSGLGHAGHVTIHDVGG